MASFKLAVKLATAEFFAEGDEQAVVRQYDRFLEAFTQPPRSESRAVQASAPPPPAEPSAGSSTASDGTSRSESGALTARDALGPAALTARDVLGARALAAREVLGARALTAGEVLGDRVRSARDVIGPTGRDLFGTDVLVRDFIPEWAALPATVADLYKHQIDAVADVIAQQEREIRECWQRIYTGALSAASSPGPLKSSLAPPLLEKLFATEGDGTVWLRKPAATPAASILACLYGAQVLNARESVTGGVLQASLVRSGVQVARLDRELDAVPMMVRTEGERRGRRYALTSEGVKFTEENILKGLLGETETTNAGR